ncbi:DUF1679 domain-containing protein [Siminovitchia acidinfaciens]|uniref:DUF1679 domain-containing protein n=1 Tax=Siminovitchia acidinfaciens TaxID=2321395 RepID=A0A429Y4H9_9BACI|nr:phosphotransferase [Siminovitchia acidinfaciens]RST76313.1 DUF1679 domain-containing protein [Siminovitchia acidinfaciens]
MAITEKQIIENWNQWGLVNKIPIKFKGSLRKRHMTVIKDTETRSVWRIDVPLSDGSFPVILKIYKESAFNSKQIESLLYKNLKDTEINEFIPVIYDIRIISAVNETWIFMENLKVMNKKQDFSPEDLYKIVSRVAQFHAKTFENQPVANLITSIVPGFQTERRSQHLESLKTHLQQARKDSFLQPLINQYCPHLFELAELDLDFPEVIQSGMCLVHGDLHLGNICYDEKNKNRIKFIDISAATFSPCWLDVVKTVEFTIDNRPEWADISHKIRRKSIRIYTREMNQRGISFTEDPGRLYRLAYLMTVFEKELRRHLMFILQGETRLIFPQILKKISLFSEEVDLI